MSQLADVLKLECLEIDRQQALVPRRAVSVAATHSLLEVHFPHDRERLPWPARKPSARGFDVIRGNRQDERVEAVKVSHNFFPQLFAAPRERRAVVIGHVVSLVIFDERFLVRLGVAGSNLVVGLARDVPRLVAWQQLRIDLVADLWW